MKRKDLASQPIPLISKKVQITQDYESEKQATLKKQKASLALI